MSDLQPKTSIRRRIVWRLELFVAAVMTLYALLAAVYLNHHLGTLLESTLKTQANNVLLATEDNLANLQANMQRLSSSDVIINAVIDVQGRSHYIPKLIDDFNTSNRLIGSAMYDFSGKEIYSSLTNQQKQWILPSMLHTSLELGQEQFIYLAEQKLIAFIQPVVYYGTTQAAILSLIDFPDLLTARETQNDDIHLYIYSGDNLIYGPDNLHQPDYQVISQTIHADQGLAISRALDFKVRMDVDSQVYYRPIIISVLTMAGIGIGVLFITYFIGLKLSENIAHPIIELSRRISPGQ